MKKSGFWYEEWVDTRVTCYSVKKAGMEKKNWKDEQKKKKKKIEKVGSLFGLELAQKSMSPQFYWDGDTMGWRFPSFFVGGEKK